MSTAWYLRDVSSRGKPHPHAAAILSSILTHVRTSSGITQTELASKLNIPFPTLRSYVSGWSAPVSGSENFNALKAIANSHGLMDQFKSYEDALQLSNTSGSREASSQMSILLRRGSAEEACTLLVLQRDAMRFDEVAEFEIELSRLYFERGEQARGLTFGMAAISTVKERFPAAAIKYCDEVAGRLVILDANHEAIELLQDSLVRWPDSALLWKRIGTALWYDNQLVAGYAALSTSLALGTPRHLIFHPRGQVLAELGNYDRAIDELEFAIKHPTSIISQAYARSTQLYARFCRDGDLAVLSEYDEIQQITPGNAWMFWFHARCRCIAGDIDLAVPLFRASLESRSPALPPWKRAFAQEEIRRILDDNGS